jgi:DNA mismatch repair protein MutL
LRGRADRSVQFFFVNGRPVKDRILQAALNQAYTGILERARSAEAFLFLTLPYADVDVNVHPAKAEVRFRDSQLAFRLVLRVVEHATLKERTVKDVYPAAGETWTPPGVAEPATAGLGFGPGDADAKARTLQGPEAWENVRAGKAGAGPEVLGQYGNLYIVAGAEDGLLVIDQHNAHERVLYEKYLEIDRRKLWPRKALLIPEILDLSPSQVVAFEESAVLFEDLGFRAESMGGRSVALKEYPDIFKPGEAREVFLALLEEAGSDKAQDRRERFLATLACKTAVKAGEPLTAEKMGYLVDELFKTAQPALCPHGRPIVVKVPRAQLDKGLRRAPASN